MFFLRRLRDLLGNKIILLVLFGIFLGAVAGIIEVGFSFAFKNFLTAFGLFPDTGETNQFLFFSQHPVRVLLVIGILQLILNFSSSALPQFIYEAFNTRIRRLITEQTFVFSKNETWSSVSAVSHIFSNVVPKVAVFMSAGTLFFTTAITMAVLLIAMAKISLQLTGVTIGALIVFNTPLLLLKGAFHKYSGAIYNLTTQFTHALMKGLKNLYFLRIVGTERKESNRLLQLNKSIFHNYIRYIAGFQTNSSWPIFGGLLVIMLLVFVNEKNRFILPINLVPFLYLLVRFSLLISRLAASFTQMRFSSPFLMELLQHESLFHTDIRPILERPVQSVLQETPSGLRASSLCVGRNKPYFEPISFEIGEGDFLLISGKSGIGKTTLLMTLIGLVPRLGGEVFWNEKPLKSLDISGLKKYVGYSGPDPFLLDGTIRENLLYGSFDGAPQPEEIARALEIAQCDFIFHLPGQLDHVLKESGEGVSAGQKQRLSIARAFLRKPKILLFDEATSNIDEPTEELIFSSIKKAYPNMLTIAVSHRQSLVKFATKTLEL